MTSKSSLRKLPGVVVLWLLLLPLAVQSRENVDSAVADTMRAINLKEVSVTATPRRIATVQEIKGADLQNLSTTSIADALKYFAGVQIKDYGGLGGLKTINVRSLGAQHVGVYIDGVRINNAQNGTVDLGKYSLSTLESVSLYNANKLDLCQSPSEYASGSTVYLRTRRPDRDSLSLSARYGSFSTYSGRVNAQLVRGAWHAFVDAEYLNTKGDYKFRYKSEYEDTVGRRKNSDIEYGRVQAAVFNKGFSAHAYYYQSERGCPGGIVRRLTDKFTNIGREWDKDFFLQSSWQRDLSPKFIFKTTGKYSWEYLRYCTDYPDNQNTARVNNHYHTHDAYLSLSGAYRHSPLLNVNIACDGRLTWMRADLKRFEPVRRDDVKAVAAVQGTWRGLRYAGSMLYQYYHDHTSLKAGAAEPLSRFTPAVSLSYTCGNLTLKSWYKKIFRVPTLNDLYYTQSGNRNLKPEYTRQINIGAEYSLMRRLWEASIQADLYRNSVDNRIVCLPLKGTYTWTMMNYGKTLCHGLNSTARVRFMPGEWNFALLCSLTWQRDVNRTDPESTTYDRPICYSPALSYGITAVAGWRQFSVTVSDLHVGERMWSYADPEDVLKPYNNVDVKISGAYRSVQASVEIFDLFDVQYEHLPRYPLPGRNFRLTVSYTF